MPDWNAIFTALAAFAIAYNTWTQKRAQRKADAARVAAEEAKVAADTAANHERLALRARLSVVISTVTTIRSEGNSAVDILLRSVAKTQRRLYESNKDPEDLKLAETAERRADEADTLHAEIDRRLARAKEEQTSIEDQIKNLNGKVPPDCPYGMN